MKRLLISLAAVALLAVPASAQALSRADVTAQCLAAPDSCAAVLEAYLATLPPAARLAAFEAITAILAEAGIEVAVATPAPPTTSTSDTPSSLGGSSGGAPVQGSPS